MTKAKGGRLYRCALQGPKAAPNRPQKTQTTPKRTNSKITATCGGNFSVRLLGVAWVYPGSISGRFEALQLATGQPPVGSKTCGGNFRFRPLVVVWVSPGSIPGRFGAPPTAAGQPPPVVQSHVAAILSFVLWGRMGLCGVEFGPLRGPSNRSWTAPDLAPNHDARQYYYKNMFYVGPMRTYT